MYRFLKYLVAVYVFLFSIGCWIGYGGEKPTHFDIRNMVCKFTYDKYSNSHHHDGEFLNLIFTDSIYYFNAGMNFSGYGDLYANDYVPYLPTEEIEKIVIIAHSYNANYHSGDTINSITNIEELLQNVAYQAQERISVSFTEPHTVPRHLTVEYFQTNGEHYTCEVKDEI